MLVIHFGTPSRQNDCARRQPLSPGSPRSGPLLRHETTPCGRVRAAHRPYGEWLDAVWDALCIRPPRLRVYAPSPLRAHARAHGYRGLRAFASLSMARSVCHLKDGLRDDLLTGRVRVPQAEAALERVM